MSGPRLSKNFSLAEFCVSQTAARMGRKIVPTTDQADRIEALVRNVLQPLRDELGRTIVVTSGLRPLWLNTAIGGAETSQHIEGEAADFVVPGMTTREVVEAAIDLELPFDQVINEFPPDGWVHISYSSIDPQRGQILTAYYDEGTKYKMGLGPRIKKGQSED